jgi:outer membrane protein
MLRVDRILLALAGALVLAGRAAADDTAYTPPDFLRSEPVLPGDPGNAWRLDLSTAIQVAVQNNLHVAMQRETVAIGDLGIVQASGAFEPQLQGQYAHMAQTEPPTTLQAGVINQLYTTISDGWGVNLFDKLESSGTVFQLGVQEVRSSSTLGTAVEPLNYFSQVTVGVTQPVLHGFSFDGTIQRVDILRAKLGADHQRDTLAITITDVVEKTEDAYWELVRAIHGYDLAVRTEKVADDQLALTHRQIDAGLLPTSDVIAAESTVAQRQLAVVQGEEQIEAAADQLRGQLNLPRDKWAQPILPTDTPTFQPDATSAEDALQLALHHRPELAAADLDVAAAALTVRKADNDKLPEIDLGAQVSLVGEEAKFGDSLDQLGGGTANAWQATVNVTWAPLRRAANAAAQAARDNAHLTALQRDQTVQQVWLEVRDAVRSQRSAARQVIAAARARSLAEQTLDIEQRRFVNSQSSTFVVAGRQQELASAQLAELAAVLDHQKASAALLRATGRLLTARNVELR